MADPGLPSAQAGDARRFLIFRMGERRYALPAEEISEVIRVPAVARMPQGPKSLMGVANLRGAVLPVASLRGLLGQDLASGSATRAIVLDGAAPVALAVDSVDALVSVGADRIETGQAALAAQPGERLRGAFRADGGQNVIKILDIQGLLAEAFVQGVRPRRAHGLAVGVATPQSGEEAAEGRKLVTFDVDGQEFALGLDVVQEIITAPQTLAGVPHSEALLLGVTAYRDTLLPVLSLRGLLGRPVAAQSDGREKVLVTRLGGALVGLLADRMRAIIAVDPALVDAPPSMLAARIGGESQIKAIYRGEGGRRLISILAPEQLFREEIMQRLGDGAEPRRAGSEDAAARQEVQFLIFRLGDDEFGLPIDTVDEVSQVPDRITRVPKTPEFLEGVVNLRGEVLPVVDQRRRFDMPRLEDSERRRLVVVRTERHRAGLIVDSVSEVRRSTVDAIEAAPDLTGEATRLVNGVINLEGEGRIILLLDPAELLSRTERGLLDAFEAGARADL